MKLQHDLTQPILHAMSVYKMEECYRTFQEDLELHLATGFVHSTPEYFIMGRPVRSDAPEIEIMDAALPFQEPDCWHIHLAAGNIKLFWKHEDGLRLPFVTWERRNVLKGPYKMETVRRIVDAL